MRAISGQVQWLVVKPAASGWVIEGDGKGIGFDDLMPIAGISDDEGLIEWFQAQLGFGDKTSRPVPPNPGPEAKPAEHGAPPVAADIGQLAAEHAAALLTLVDVRKALEPFASMLRLEPNHPDLWILFNAIRHEPYAYLEVTVGQLRDLLRAAGMLTAEMEPKPSAEAVAEAAPVPAAPDDETDVGYPPPCTDPGGHEFECTGTAYGGDDERWHGEGRMLCVHCGADGDA